MKIKKIWAFAYARDDFVVQIHTVVIINRKR